MRIVSLLCGSCLVLCLLNGLACIVESWFEKLFQILSIEQIEDFVDVVHVVLLWFRLVFRFGDERCESGLAVSAELVMLRNIFS